MSQPDFSDPNDLQFPVFPRRDHFLIDVIHQFVVRRQDIGLSQDEVDHIMGNPDRLVSKWECGMQIPTSFNLYCWAEAIRCQLKICVVESD